MFAKRLKEAMAAQNVSQAELSKITGISRSGISQYLSGKNIPSRQRITVLAAALGVTEEWFESEGDSADDTNFDSCALANVPVAMAAKLMGVSEEFIRIGLQRGTLPFGYAVKINGSRFTYYISPKKFTDHTGVVINSES